MIEFKTKQYFVSLDVKFLEHKFSFGLPEPLLDSPTKGIMVVDDACDEEFKTPCVAVPMKVEGEQPVATNEVHEGDVIVRVGWALSGAAEEPKARVVPPSMAVEVVPENNGSKEVNLKGDGVEKMGCRRCVKVPNMRLHDFVSHTVVKKKSFIARPFVPSKFSSNPLHIMLIAKKFLTTIADI